MINQIVIFILKLMKRFTKVLLVFLVLAIAAFLTVRERGIYSFWHNKVERVSNAACQIVIEEQKPIILDARNPEEFAISHLEYANLYTEHMLDTIDKAQPILVYCTIGVRSNSLANDLTKRGFTNVYELKKGILGWKNDLLPVVDEKNQLTDEIHVYSEFFSPFLKEGKAVY